MTRDTAQPLQWGLDEEAVHPIKATSVGTVVQIGNREFMAITSQRIIRFEPSVVSAYLPYQLTALVCIPEYQIIVGVTAISAEFVVILLNDVKKPIFPGIKANDASVFNILYCPKYNTLITSGEDLKTWKFSYILNKKTSIVNPPQIGIEYQRTIIYKFQGSILNPPIIDQELDIIYIDDQKGSLQKYKIDGTCIGTALKFQSTSITTVAFNYESKKFLTSNSDQGTILWHRTGHLLNRYFLSNAAALAIRFLNKEFALFFDANNVLTILDVKTSRSFACYKVSSGRISRVFFFEKPVPRIILCCNSSIIILRVVLPWRLWCTTISRPLSMVRCPKYNEAARLLVMCSDSHVKLISPSSRSTLTAITLQSLAQPIGFFYDRGTSFLKRDQVMLPLKDGTMQFFSTGENPCKLVSSFESKCICICQCKYKDQDCFVFGTSVGNLLFYDYLELKQINRAVLLPYPIIKIFNFNDSLCIVYNERLIRFSLKDEKLCESLEIKGSEISILFNGIMVFGYDTGEIGCATIDKNQTLVEYFTNGLKIHDSKVTGLSLGSSYFVSCSTDMSLRVWSNEFTLISKITFPIPLISVAILNGKRDVVVGTDSEIMFIDGNTIFNGVVDKEDDAYDNYDKLQDFLDAQFAKISENNNQGNDGTSFLGSCRRKDDSPEVVKSRPKNSKIRMFQEALRQHQEMLEQQSNKFKNNMNNMSNNRNNNNKNSSESDLEKREMLFNQMNNITNGTKRKDTDQINNILQKEKQESMKKQKQEEEEEEEQYEYEYEEEEENNASIVKPQANVDSKPKTEEPKEQKTKESPPIIMTNILSENNENKKQNEKNSLNESKTKENENENDEIEIKPPNAKKTKRPSRRAVRRGGVIPSDQLNPNPNSNQEDNDLNEENNNENISEQTNSSGNQNGNNESSSFNNNNSKNKNKGKRNNINKGDLKILREDISNNNEYKENDENNEDNGNNVDNDNNENNENQSSKQNSEKKIRRLGEPSQSDNEQRNLDLKMKSQNSNKNRSNNNSNKNYDNNNNDKSKKNSGKLNGNNSESCGTEAIGNGSKDQRRKVRMVNKATSPNTQSDDFPPEETKQAKNAASKMRKKLEYNALVDKHISSSIGNKSKMNIMMVNDRLFDVNYDKKRQQQKSAQEIKSQKAPIMNKTRRFPTPLHYVNKPVASLFERSIRTRRPKTPPCSKGLIISNSVIPTNIVFDASVLDEIMKSNDSFYQPLIKQLKPILNSQHAYFNLRVMLPADKEQKKTFRQKNRSLSNHWNLAQNEKPPPANLKEPLEIESLSIPPLSLNTISNRNSKKINKSINVEKDATNKDINNCIDKINDNNKQNSNCNIFNIDSNNITDNADRTNNIDNISSNNFNYINLDNIGDNVSYDDSSNDFNNENNNKIDPFNADNENNNNSSILSLNNLNIDGGCLNITGKSINKNLENNKSNNNSNGNLDFNPKNNTITANNDPNNDPNNDNINKVNSVNNRLSGSNGIFSNESLSFENRFVISEPFKDSNKFFSPRLNSNNNNENNSNVKSFNRSLSTAIAHINDNNIKKEGQRRNNNNINVNSNINNSNNFFNRRNSEYDGSNNLKTMDQCNNNNSIRYDGYSNNNKVQSSKNINNILSDNGKNAVSDSTSYEIESNNDALRPNKFMTIRGEQYQYRVDRPNLVEQATNNKRKISCPQTSRFIGPTSRGLLTPRKLVSVNPGKSIAFPRCLLIIGNNATKGLPRKSTSPRK